jgi:hypothetical protein
MVYPCFWFKKAKLMGFLFNYNDYFGILERKKASKLAFLGGVCLVG